MSHDDTPQSPFMGRNAEVFERVYLDHFARVRSFLRNYIGRAGIADDLAQDTFLQIWLHPNGFDPSRSNLKAYLFGIARKRAADWRRHHPSLVNEYAEPRGDAPSEALALKDALARLEPDLRNVLWLREAEGYSYDELARILDVPLGTVKSRLFAAREQLRRIWNGK